MCCWTKSIFLPSMVVAVSGRRSFFSPKASLYIPPSESGVVGCFGGGMNMSLCQLDLLGVLS